MLTLLRPPPPSAEETVDLDAWLFERMASSADDSREALDAELVESTRDDGVPYHGRAPSEDIDPFNPHVIARASTMPLTTRPTLMIVRPPVMPVEHDPFNGGPIT